MIVLRNSWNVCAKVVARKKQRLCWGLLGCVLLGVTAALWTPQAQAWNERTESAIVSNAVHLLSKEDNIPLRRQEKEVRAGLQLSDAEMETLHPGYSSNPLMAIENEVYLLQSVRGDRVDAYLAYRLGILGKMVANVTAPMQNAPTSLQDQYYNDVDQHIQQVQLKLSPRKRVEVRTYLPIQMTAASANDAVFQSEYAEGQGFDGLAGALIAEDTSRSLEVVANIWYTILTSSVSPGSVSDSQLQEYVLNAYEYIIPRGNTNEINAAEERLGDLVELSPGMKVQVGDMFIDAGMEERAIQVFQQVIAEDPNRRDVVERIADYYVERGEEALENERYQAAIEDFSLALDTFPLHDNAERLRLEAQSALEAREARLAADQEALERAAEFEQLAEQEAQRERFAEAIVLLNQARASYQEVSDEFPTESRLRTVGLESVRELTDSLKGELMDNAQDFAGSGFHLDAQSMARENLTELDREALQDIFRNTYEAEIDALGNSLRDVEPPQ